MSYTDSQISKSLVEGTQPAIAAGAPARRRLSLAARERQILEAAIRFFAKRGFNGQLRDLAKEIGVTHALLYHYFPTKKALIERVYAEVFEGRWKEEWEQILDDDSRSPLDKLSAFYCDYARVVLTYDFVRILVYSGLDDQIITERFFALLRKRLLPRLIRETRRHCGVALEGRASARELELLMGLHGGIFYTGIRHWVYGQAIHHKSEVAQDDEMVCDRVRAYLISAKEILYSKG
ncbi:MAG: TetR/AcrR family transcriptional regulator [Burkholderiaceae bacterium]|nr:TetR/AcrR family transcriptional regulator [Burkholderiaceae bacterium]